MRSIIQSLLQALARVTLRRYQPLVVAVTGSVGKTSTKEAIFAVLKKRYRVRRSVKSYNTEIGVPLAILGLEHQGRSVAGWLRALVAAFWRLLVDRTYPDILILEYGVQRPKDMDDLLDVARPFIGVMTAIGEIPVHVEFFNNSREVAAEKAKLIAAIPAEGYAIFNADDAALVAVKHRTRGHVLSFGFGPDAVLRVRNYRLFPEGPGLSGAGGISFTLVHGGREAAVVLHNTFGKQQAYAAAAAACVGLAFNLSLLEIASALAAYEAPPGRLKLLHGEKNSWILDDTYNASPLSTLAALEVLAEFPAKRRIAVLGDMLELGTYTESAHRTIGEAVRESADHFIAVGERMRFAAREASQSTNSGRALDRAHVHWVARAEEAGRVLESLLLPEDVVLIKGSRAMMMERVVTEIMMHPEQSAKLLVTSVMDVKRRSLQ